MFMSYVTVNALDQFEVAHNTRDIIRALPNLFPSAEKLKKIYILLIEWLIWGYRSVNGIPVLTWDFSVSI